MRGARCFAADARGEVHAVELVGARASEKIIRRTNYIRIEQFEWASQCETSRKGRIEEVAKGSARTDQGSPQKRRSERAANFDLKSRGGEGLAIGCVPRLRTVSRLLDEDRDRRGAALELGAEDRIHCRWGGRCLTLYLNKWRLGTRVRVSGQNV